MKDKGPCHYIKTPIIDQFWHITARNYMLGNKPTCGTVTVAYYCVWQHETLSTIQVTTPPVCPTLNDWGNPTHWIINSSATQYEWPLWAATLDIKNYSSWCMSDVCQGSERHVTTCFPPRWVTQAAAPQRKPGTQEQQMGEGPCRQRCLTSTQHSTNHSTPAMYV